jgi:hypothetical protein
MITLYHGTNNPDSIGLRRPVSGNTTAFYLTPCREIAQSYGSHLLEFNIPSDCDIHFTIRPLGNTGTSEWLVTTQQDFNKLLKLEW